MRHGRHHHDRRRAWRRKGWVIDDRKLDEGGLQFDNGECGVARLELYDLTKDMKYLAAAQTAADWTIPRPCVPSWNYGSSHKKCPIGIDAKYD